jgi:hypothetical protein
MNPYLKTRQTGLHRTRLIPNLVTTRDRCDRCGARAQAVVIMKSERELLFCGHHTDKYQAALIGQGANIYREGY